MAKKYKIVHDREGCIGCQACVVINPDNWVMSDDGKSDPKKTEFGEEKLKQEKDAAESCPVNVIHIIDEETGEKII